MKIKLPKINRIKSDSGEFAMNDHQKKIRNMTLKLNTFPVSPFFTAKVLNNAKFMNSRSVWDYMQILSANKLRGVLLAMLVIFVILIQIPASNDDLYQAQTIQDYPYLIQDEQPAIDINNNDQALLFALSN